MSLDNYFDFSNIKNLLCDEIRVSNSLPSTMVPHIKCPTKIKHFLSEFLYVAKQE